MFYVATVGLFSFGCWAGGEVPFENRAIVDLMFWRSVCATYYLALKWLCPCCFLFSLFTQGALAICDSSSDPSFSLSNFFDAAHFVNTKKLQIKRVIVDTHQKQETRLLDTAQKSNTDEKPPRREKADGNQSCLQISSFFKKERWKSKEVERGWWKLRAMDSQRRRLRSCQLWAQVLWTEML